MMYFFYFGLTTLPFQHYLVENLLYRKDFGIKPNHAPLVSQES